MSSTSSRRCSTGAASSPGTGSAPPRRPESSTMIPSCSSPRPSSRAEQIIPSETCPYVFRAAMANPPGSTAPGSETTTRSPTAKLCAPQTMPREAGTSRPPHPSEPRGVVVLRPDVDPAPADDLAVLLRLVDVGQHPTDHQRTGDIGTGLLDRLDLQTGADQVLGQAATVEIVGQRGVVPQPAQRRPHRAPSIGRPHRAPSIADALIGRVPAGNGCSARLPRSCRACPRRRCGTSGCGPRPSRTRNPSRRSSPPRRPPAPAG